MAYIIKNKSVLQKTDGSALKNSEEILNPTCGCGIECCDGFIKLNSYSSTGGPVTTMFAYIVDGEFVIQDETTARAAVKALKALVNSPSPTPSSTPPAPTPTPSGV